MLQVLIIPLIMQIMERKSSYAIAFRIDREIGSRYLVQATYCTILKNHLRVCAIAESPIF